MHSIKSQLTVLKRVKVNNRWLVLTRCTCGKEELKRPDHVKNFRVVCCKRCSAKRTAKQFPPPLPKRTGYKGLSGTHFLHIKNCAKRRQLEFNLTPIQLWELFEKQHGFCALTGLTISLTNSIKNNSVDWDTVTASLDRIDSTKGYTIDNVWWVHKTINRLKNNYSLAELLFWAKKLLAKHGNSEQSSGNELNVPENVQRLGSADSTNNLPTSAQPHISG